MEWQRLRDRGATDHGALLTADRTIEVLVRRRRLTSAAEVSGWMVTIARGVIQAQGETPEALRDLSVSLRNLGTLEQAAGHTQTAKDLLQEGLEIAERLAATVPDHVDYLNSRPGSGNGYDLSLELSAPTRARPGRARMLYTRTEYQPTDGETR